MSSSLIYLWRASGVAIKTLYYSSRALLASTDSPVEDYFRLSRDWSHSLLKSMHVTVRLSGLEHVNFNQAYIVASNHSSLLDIPVLLANLPLNAAIIYKEELQKVPLFGRMLRKSPFPAVNRDDSASAMRSLKASAKLVRSGSSVLIFPEGTRSEDGELGEFKDGAFTLAKWLKVPILPVALVGTNDLLPKGTFRFRSGEVHLTIGTSIIPAELESADLSQRTRLSLEEMINKSRIRQK